MTITVVAPEVLITINFGHLVSARKTLKALKKYAGEDGVPWSLMHSLFANMGGFVVRDYTRGREDAFHIFSSSGGSLGGNKENEELEMKELHTSDDGIQVSSEGVAATTSPTREIIEDQSLKEPQSHFILAFEILEFPEKGLLSYGILQENRLWIKARAITLHD
jgi:hypothetical protein